MKHVTILPMKIAIVGGGFTGLTAAYELAKNGFEVSLFEAEKTLGGLAGGFRAKNWRWPLEKTYHHWFTNDRELLALSRELGLADKLIIQRPITASFWQNQAYPLDSALNLLAFPGLPLLDKLRTGFLLALLKLNPYWKPLETLTAKRLLWNVGGSTSWRILWQPLMEGKFNNFSEQIAASWFWARIKKRTPRLGYITGGFQTLIDALEQAIIKSGAKIITGTPVTKIFASNHKIILRSANQKYLFDQVLLTVPTPIGAKIIPQLPPAFLKPLLSIPHLHAQTLILETKQPILQKVYWLNITDRSFPFLAVVAHTNFMETHHYHGHHLTYFGNYLSTGHPYLSLTKEQILKEFLPFIKRLNRQFDNSQLVNSYLFFGPFAQPVHTRFYSRRAPKLVTPVPHVYLANLDSIYPWDRGTNYAIELGLRAARAVMKIEGVK